MYLGDFPAAATIDFKWNTMSAAAGSITRATNGSIRVYKANSATQRSTSSGITDTEDFDSLTGLHHCRIDLSDDTDAGFYAAGSDYQVVIQGMVVDGITINAVIAGFSIENRSALRPTTSGRTLDVTATGAAGIDWSNVENPTTTLNLSATTVKTATDVETDTADIQSRLPAALTAGGNIKADALAVSGSTTAADNIEVVFDTDFATAYDTTGNAWVVKLTSDYEFAKGTEAMTESYAANGVAPTPIQALYGIQQILQMFGISGTSLTVKKLDNATTAFVVTLNDATSPTGAART